MQLLQYLAIPALGILALVIGWTVPVDMYLLAMGSLTLGCLVVAATAWQISHYLTGLTVLIISAVAFPMQIEFGESSRAPVNAAFPLAAFLFLCWILKLLVMRRRVPMDCPPAVRACLALTAVTIVAFAAGQYPWFDTAHAPIRAQLAEVGLFVLSCGLFLSAGYELNQRSDVRHITWVFLAAGTFVVITQTFSALGVLGAWSAAQSIGSGFWTWFVALSAGQALCNRDLKVLSRSLLLGVCGLSLFRSLFEAGSWVSGWLPSLIALVIVLLFRFPRVTTSLVLLALPAGLDVSAQLSDVILRNESYSLTTRLEAWRILAEIAVQNPFLGVGPANYYFYTPLFPIMGWTINFNSHNQYIDLILQTGLLGLGTFFWLTFEMTRYAFTLRLDAPDGFTHGYSVAIIGGIAGTLASGMLADWIVPFIYNLGVGGFRSSLLFWIFLGGALALRRGVPVVQVVRS